MSKTNKIIVEKSTVPVRTAEAIEKVLRRNCSDSTVRFDILSNPEFLAEGTAMTDLDKPDRVLIGGKIEGPEGQAAVDALAEVYANWVPQERILRANLWSAELSKLAANAFLAQRISSINAISALCEATGADVSQVAHALGTDSRIGTQVPQRVRRVRRIVLPEGYPQPGVHLRVPRPEGGCGLLVQRRRHEQLPEEPLRGRVVSAMFNTIRNKKVAMLGFAFKKDTGDTRETPAIDVGKGLIEDGAQLAIFDPKVSEEQIAMDMEGCMENITCYKKREGGARRRARRHHHDGVGRVQAVRLEGDLRGDAEARVRLRRKEHPRP